MFQSMPAISRRFKIPLILGGLVAANAIGFVLLVLLQSPNAGQDTGSQTLLPRAVLYTPQQERLLVGKSAPAFILQGLDNASHGLPEYRGKVVMLNFWATWCAPCRLEMPLLEKNYEHLKAAGLVIVAVNQAEDVTTVKQYIDDLKISFPILLDTDLSVTQSYAVIGLPTTFFIDTKGVIQAKQIGMLTEDSLGQYLEQFGLSQQGQPTSAR